MNFFFSQLKVIILIFNFISGIFSNRTFRISASSYTYNETDTRLANYGISWKIFTRFFTFDSFLYQILFTSSISRTFTVRMQNKVWHISILYTHIYIHIYTQAFSFYNSNGATRAIELLETIPDPYFDSFASSSVISHESTPR